MGPVDASRPLSFGTRLSGLAARGPANASSIWSDPPERGRKVLELGLCSTIFAWLILDVLQKGDDLAVDFHYAFWPAARAVLGGRSPFPAVIDFYHLPFVYPAPAALLFAPFGLLPRTLADVLFTVLLAACLFFTLRLLCVADWRCYGIAFLWAPIFSALQTANLTLLLALGLALLWRLRDRTLAPAFVAAILIALKIFLWPVVLWLAIRRGWRVAAWSILVTASVTLVSWGAIGFAGFTKYPGLVRLINQVEAPRSYSLVALGMRVGLGRGASTALALAIAGAVLAGALVLAKREADGRRSFVLTIAATILLSPVVWLHYFALLVVPVAILRPRFGPVWFLPLLLWPCPVMISGPTWSPLAPLLLFGSAFIVTLARGRVVDLEAGEPAVAPL